MEKLRREWVDNGVLHWEPVYSAAEVDAYRQAVKALVEAAKRVQVDYDTLCVYVNDPMVRWRTYQATVNTVQHAISEFEAAGMEG